MSFPSHRKDATADRVNDGRPFLIGIMGRAWQWLG